jgi:hypothetical protein
VRDAVIVTLLVLGFALLVTAHVALCGFLVLRAKPRWRGLAAFVVPPLAPWWGLREGRTLTTSLWIVSLLLYLSGVLAAKITG